MFTSISGQCISLRGDSYEINLDSLVVVPQVLISGGMTLDGTEPRRMIHIGGRDAVTHCFFDWWPGNPNELLYLPIK